MASGATPSRWKVIAARATLLAATFAAGWLASDWAIKNGAATNGAIPRVKYSTASPTDLAQLKADLAKALKPTGDSKREHALLKIIAGLDADSVKALLADIAANPKSDDSDAMELLVERLTELDPKAAFDWTANIPDSQKKKAMVKQVLKDWSDKSPADALAALQTLPAGLLAGVKNAVLSQLFMNWSNKNPADALAALRALPLTMQSVAGQDWGEYGGDFDNYDVPTHSLYSDIFKAWAAKDPAAAAAAALNLPPSVVRNDVIKAMAAAWAGQSPASALAWVNTLPAGSAKNDALSATINAVAGQDPQAAADFVSAMPNSASRDSLLENIAETWTGKDPTAALAWADTLTGVVHDDAIKSAIEVYADADPASAANYYVTHQASFKGDDYFDTFSISDSWTEKDGPAALAYALALPATNDAGSTQVADLRNELIRGVLYDMDKQNPVNAAAVVQNLTTDPHFTAYSNSLAIAWVNVNPHAALNWAKSLPAGDAQNTAVSEVVGSLATVDPQAALSDAQQLTGDNRDVTLKNVITSWANLAPAQAAAALTNLPDGDNLDAATTSVAAAWLKKDPAAASQWIDTLAPGDARDGAVTALIDSDSNNNPSTAYTWALTLSDQAARNNQVVDLLRQWTHANPADAAAAAQNALNLTGLSDVQKGYLQKIATKTTTP